MSELDSTTFMRCTRCSVVYPATDIYFPRGPKTRARPVGLKPACQICTKLSARANYRRRSLAALHYPNPPASDSKHCRSCKRDRPVWEFHKNRANPDGVAHYCAECTNRYNRNLRPLKNGPREGIRLMSDAEAAWLAGWLEGEGCFQLRWKHQHDRARPYLTMQITGNSVDREVLETVQNLTGVGRLTVEQRANKYKNSQDLWGWRVGRREWIREILQRIRPWMHSRRREKIDAMLGYLRE